jgi:hypothetical protein
MKQSKINIMCLFWRGEFRERDFSMNDVIRLYQSVKKHADREFQFYCLTNVDKTEFPEYVTPIPLLHNFPGWWSKIELHRPDLPAGRTLYMDLDSFAIRSLQPIFDYAGDLVMFNTKIPKRRWDKMEEGWVCKYQAGNMLFTPYCPPMKLVYEVFMTDPQKWMKQYRSEQDVMGAWIPTQPVMPDSWLIKLALIGVRGMHVIPEDCIIVTGQPKDNSFRNLGSRFVELEKMARL